MAFRDGSFGGVLLVVTVRFPGVLVLFRLAILSGVTAVCFSEVFLAF